MNITKKFINRNIQDFDPSYEYWNDEDIEKKKLFYDIDALEQSDEQQFFIKEINQLISHENRDIDSFLSVCCGNMWIEANAFKNKKLRNFIGIDYSQHRVHKLAEKSIEHLNVSSKVELICGNILEYETDIKFDLIYLSKAFHHIESPIVLLRKLKELLSPNGKIIICGEHYYGSFIYLKRLIKHFIKYLIIKDYRKIRSFLPEYGMLFPYSLEKGDIHYSLYNYHYFFKKMNFDYTHNIHKERGFQTFILTHKTTNDEG